MRQYRLRVDLVLILAALAALAGCSSSSGATSAPPEPIAAASARPGPSSAAPAAPSAEDVASNDSRPVIACFGDSLTAGYGIDPSTSYPADLQHRLDADGYRYRVLNEGVSGDTTKDGLERIDRVLTRKPQIVVLEFGGNDGLRGLPVSTAQQNMAAMIERLQKGGAKVVLAGISLPPQYGADYISEFDAMYPALSHRFHVPLLPFILENVYGVEGDIQADGVHPTVQGAKQVAANVQHLLQPLLKK